MNIGFDVHGVIDRFPEFFSCFSRMWRIGKIYVFSGKNHDKEEIAKKCTTFGICYDEIILTGSFLTGDQEDRAQMIKKLNIEVMFDDLSEYSKHFPESCLSLLVRNDKNFDYNNKQYLFPEGDAGIRSFELKVNENR